MKSIFSSLKFVKGRGTSPDESRPNNFLRALDLSHAQILFVEGGVVAQKLFLNQVVVVPLGAETALPMGLKMLFGEKKCQSEDLRISLKSPQVTTRFLRFPKMSEKELRGVLKYEIEQYVPYEAKDLYLDLAILQESVKTEQGESTEVFVAAAKKDYLDSLFTELQAATAQISVVDIDMLACMKCLEFFHPADFSGHAAILEIGAQITTLGVVRAGQPRFIRDLSFGSQDIFKKLKSHATMSDLDIQDFIAGKTTVSEAQASIFSDCIENLINDVRVSCDYYRDQSEDGAGFDQLFVCGNGSNQEFILKALQRALDVPVTMMNLMSKMEWGPDVSQELVSALTPHFPVALGLLLRDI